MPILRAFSQLCEVSDKVQLLFAGKLADDIKDEFESYVRDNKLSERVKVTGYIEIEQFKEYIDMTDICMNLRYPSNGETSGSLMRILAKGRCVVVNDIGSFSEIPDDCCIKLPSVDKMGESRETGEIFNVLRRLIEEPQLCSEISSAARKYAEENLDIKVVAKKYFEYITADNAECMVTEKVIEALRNDSSLSRSDVSGIAATIAYAKGCVG